LSITLKKIIDNKKTDTIEEITYESLLRDWCAKIATQPTQHHRAPNPEFASHSNDLDLNKSNQDEEEEEEED